ncbi:oligosaccharide flippase family protein [Paenibacillus sp. y28]|uniref:oligosaccharide flippase family protein n=1 Tax=Paenibacillus sp. y28 TaxID=3129110 RepID=UPI00301767D0
MRQLFLSSLGVNLIVIVMNLLTGIMSAQYLGPDGRGELAAATRWSFLITVLFSIGIPGAVIYLGKQFPDRQRMYFGVYLVLGTGIGLIGMLTGQLLLPLLLGGESQHVVRIAQVAMATVPFALLADGLLGTLQTQNKFRQVLALRFINPLGLLLIILLLVVSGHYTVYEFMLCSLAWSVVTFGLTLFWALRSVKPQIRRVVATGKELLHRGTQIYAGFIVSTFGTNLDQIIISLLLTTYTLGLYSVSASIASMLPTVIIGAIGTYLFPKLMDFAPQERRAQVERIHGVLLYSTLGLAVAEGLLLPFVLPLLYGEKFAESVIMGEILLICAPLNVAYAVLTNYMSTEGKFHHVTVAEIIGLVSGLTATVILLPIAHGVGAAVGVAIIAVVKWGYLAFMGLKMGLSWSKLFGLYPQSYLGLARRLLLRRRRAEGGAI